MRRSKPHHSITSSAAACKVSGTMRPSALAVLRLGDQDTYRNSSAWPALFDFNYGATINYFVTYITVAGRRLCRLLNMPGDGRTGDQTRDTIMFTTKIFAALTLGLTILAAAPAMAAMTANGIQANGIWENGIWENGIWSNGVFQNGFTSNGFTNNGLTQNGRQADAPALRVIGIELPSEAVAR
jgi:hypothetical protein